MYWQGNADKKENVFSPYHGPLSKIKRVIDSIVAFTHFHREVVDTIELLHRSPLHLLSRALAVIADAIC